MSDFKCEEVMPFESSASGKTQQIEQMFDDIAPHYDTMNRLMSLGQDKSWRQKAIKRLKQTNPNTILDVATGTADFALSAYDAIQPARIVGVDISEDMIRVGEEKVKAAKKSDFIDLMRADSMNLPFDSQSFDAATIAFGVRNFESLEKGLTEICRVIRDGGSLAILELSVPTNPFYRFGYRIFTKIFIPIMAKILKTNSTAYSYLPESIDAFPQGEVMKALLLKVGFKEVEIKKYTMQTCTFYFATK